MSEIQVIIPLSVFGDAKDLTPQAISEAISNISDLKKENAHLTERYNRSVSMIRYFGLSLEGIWETSQNDFDRAKAIRSLINDLKDFKG